MAECAKCGGGAVVRVEYAHSDYCGECFTQNFEEKVGKANRDFRLLRRGDVVAVGVSGGKDSAALLFTLKKLAERIGEITLKPVLVDEGIAGYRDRAAKCAEQLCDRLQLPLQKISYANALGVSMDEAMQKREAASKTHRSCSYCGVFRKHCLNKAAREAGANKLAIGHNSDDVTQTFLMNLLRGEPDRNEEFGAFTGNAERALFVPRVRPLVYATELECAYYCVLNAIPFYRGGCPYAEESFRGEVKDFLNSVEEKHPGAKRSLLNSFLALKKNSFEEKEGSGEKQKIVVEVKDNFSEKSVCAKCGEYRSEASEGKLCRACELAEQLKEVMDIA